MLIKLILEWRVILITKKQTGFVTGLSARSLYQLPAEPFSFNTDTKDQIVCALCLLSNS